MSAFVRRKNKVKMRRIRKGKSKNPNPFLLMKNTYDPIKKRNTA